MKEMTLSETAKPDDLQREQSARRLPVQVDLEGHLCARCGSCRYFLVFRMIKDSRSGILAARCSRCRGPRELTQDEIERVCHPDLRDDWHGNRRGESHDA